MEAGKAQFTTIDEYINSCPEEVRATLQTLRQTIKEEVPEAEETIKYQMPTFMYHGNLVYFAAFKNHIGFYPTPSGIEATIDEVAIYKTGKGTLQFPLDQPLPLPLIRKIVQFRVQENLARKKKK
jgi:uncharacterized protein YdhG (YjbR/CyaY superfamily)